MEYALFQFVILTTISNNKHYGITTRKNLLKLCEGLKSKMKMKSSKDV